MLVVDPTATEEADIFALIEIALRELFDDSAGEHDDLINSIIRKVHAGQRALSEQDQENRMREQFPALKTAYEHYQIVRRMCETEYNPNKGGG